MPTRLSGLDAGFLYLETATMHLHVGSVVVLDPSTAPGGRVTRDRVAAHLEERLHLAPPFRRRLVRVPFDLDHPIWVEDAGFDLDFHVRRAALPSPGGMGELAEFAGDVMGRPIDRGRPLWELYVVEGLEGGRVALVTKTHHAAVDGVSGAELTAALLSADPLATPPPLDVPWRGEQPPTDLQLLAASALRAATTPLELVRAGRRALHAAADLASLLRAGDQPREVAAAAAPEDSSPGEVPPGDASPGDASPGEVPPGDVAPGEVPPAFWPGSGAGATMPFAAPLTVLNGAIGPHRRVAFAELSLGGLKEVKAALGGTVNDVVLATVAGALRRFLLVRGGSVDQALVAMVPVSVRAPDEHGLPGNRVSVMLVELPVHHADPLLRLERVKAATRRAKEQHGALGAHTIQALAEVTPGALAALAARLYTRTRAADRHRPIWNLVVSNVPGPRIPLYCAGARMEALYPLGPIHEMSGLNVTLLSYLDTIFVGLNADRGLLPDVDRIAGALGDAAQELVKAAGERRG